MYESRTEPPLERAGFIWRVIVHAAIAGGLLAASIGIGMFGYMHFEPIGPMDAFLNVTMLLGGMGPVTTSFTTDEGKFFAGCFALYAGLVFIVASALIFTPVVHRVLHKFHWDSED